MINIQYALRSKVRKNIDANRILLTGKLNFYPKNAWPVYSQVWDKFHRGDNSRSAAALQFTLDVDEIRTLERFERSCYCKNGYFCFGV